jgi:hypothetical protein
MIHGLTELYFLEKVYQHHAQVSSLGYEIITSIFQLISLLIFVGIPITIIWFIVWMVKKVKRIETHLETIAKNMEKEAKN